jgi:peroxiredoxin Q/BCP
MQNIKKINIGDISPMFEGHSTHGNLSSQNFKNKNIVLYFYPKDMTSGCTKQAQDFSKNYSKFKSYNTEIIGVSRDTIKKHCIFSKKENIPYPLLSDMENKICLAYGVIKEKSIFGKKYLGINRTTFLIDTGYKIFKIWRSVKVPNHAQTVLNIVCDLYKKQTNLSTTIN